MIVALARKLLIALWRLVRDRRGAGGRRPASGVMSGDRTAGTRQFRRRPRQLVTGCR